MAEHLIVTLNRQFGSGGKEVGSILAKSLGIPLYDSEITELASQKSGIRKEYFDKADEKPTDSFLYALAMNTFSMNNGMNPLDNTLSNDRLFNVQADVIRDLAQKESFVLIGRCGEYILRDEPGCIRIYIHGPMEARIKRIMRIYKMTEKEAQKKINAMDKRRESYYGYYAGKEWSSCNSYDLSIDTSVLGTEKAAELIKKYIELREK